MDNGASSYRRFLSSDDNGIVDIIKDYKDGLMLFLNRYVNNLPITEELTEDTFFRLVTKKPRFMAKSSFKTWLYAIGRNIAINYIRHSNTTAETPIEDLTTVCADALSVEQAYLREEQNLQLNKALSHIRSDYATVLHLKFFEEMSNEEISHVLKLQMTAPATGCTSPCCTEPNSLPSPQREFLPSGFINSSPSFLPLLTSTGRRRGKQY